MKIEVSLRISRSDGYAILRADSGGFSENAVADTSLNLLDLLNCSLLVEAVDEEINVRSRSKSIVIVIATSCEFTR
jgi:hypothetical protein